EALPSLRPMPSDSFPSSQNTAPSLAPIQEPVLLGPDGAPPNENKVQIPDAEPVPAAPKEMPAPVAPAPYNRPPYQATQTPCSNCGGSMAIASPAYGSNMTDAPVCNVLCCPCGDPMGPWWTRFYGSAEFLLWWMSNTTSPPLLATAPTRPTNVDPIPAGTTILFDGS